MARSAIANDTIVTKDRWFERSGRMTKMTILGSGDMRCCSIFACGYYTVMATFTALGNTLMTKRRRLKPGSNMAGTTLINGWNMIGSFTG